MDMHPEVPGEREPPLYFAGRQDELDAFDAKLRRLCASADPSGGLQLTVGVPGIGKTQLALQFATRIEGSVVLGRKVATLRLSPEALDSPVDLFKAMAFALDERAQGDQVAQHHDRVSGATAGVLGARGALAIDIVRHTPDLPGLLRESLRAGMWQDRTLVLMVDELQRIGAKGMSALCVLHDGVHGCPILLTGFGLQHTERTLANPPSGNGISRLATPATLTTLDHDDTVDAFVGNLSRLGHDDIPPASVEALAGASFGVPPARQRLLGGRSRRAASPRAPDRGASRQRTAPRRPAAGRLLQQAPRRRQQPRADAGPVVGVASRQRDFNVLRRSQGRPGVGRLRWPAPGHGHRARRRGA